MIVDINKCNTDEIEFIQIMFDNRQQFFVHEDKVNWINNTLAKNFAGCNMIKAMLEQVYIAGQKGEDVEFRVNII